jgi:hypothetical protein
MTLQLREPVFQTLLVESQENDFGAASPAATVAVDREAVARR